MVLEYCCPVWNTFKIADIQAVETVKRQFIRKIAGWRELNYWNRLRKLDLLSLQRRRERYTIIQVWKIYRNLTPNDTGMEFYHHPRLGVRAKVPSFNTSAQRSVSSAYEESFGVNGARPWNILPANVNTQTTLEGLKSSLGAFLKSIPDYPPVPGYTPPNSNSLITWRAVGGASGEQTWFRSPESRSRGKEQQR